MGLTFHFYHRQGITVGVYYWDCSKIAIGGYRKIKYKLNRRSLYKVLERRVIFSQFPFYIKMNTTKNYMNFYTAFILEKERNITTLFRTCIRHSNKEFSATAHTPSSLQKSRGAPRKTKAAKIPRGKNGRAFPRRYARVLRLPALPRNSHSLYISAYIQDTVYRDRQRGRTIRYKLTRFHNGPHYATSAVAFTGRARALVRQALFAIPLPQSRRRRRRRKRKGFDARRGLKGGGEEAK